MHKRVYISEDTEKLELEVSWSANGIHLDIGQSDNTYLASLVFNEFDIEILIEELTAMKDFYSDSKKEINKDLDSNKK